MTQQVQAPNGDIVEFPDETPQAEMEAAMRKTYGGPDTGPSFAEAGKRFLAGAGAGVAAVPKFAERIAQSSARALDLPDWMTRGIGTGEPMAKTPEEGPLYKVGQSITDALPTPNPNDTSLTSKAAGVTGSIAGLLAAYAAGGPGAAALVGASQGGEDAADMAKAKGATPEQQNQVAFETAPVTGALNVLPVGRIAGRLGSDAAKSVIETALKSGAENAAAGGASQVGQNVIAQSVYDPDRPTMENVPEAALTSGIGAGVVSGAARGAQNLRVKPTPVPTPEAPPVEVAALPAPTPDNRPPFRDATGATTEHERATNFQAEKAKAETRVSDEKSAAEGGYKATSKVEPLLDKDGNAVTTKDGRPLYVPIKEAETPHIIYGEGEKAPRTSDDLSQTTAHIAERTGEDPVKLVENQLGIPPEQFHALPGDAKERVVQAAQRQRAAERPDATPLRTADEAARPVETMANRGAERPTAEGDYEPVNREPPQPAVGKQGRDQPTASNVEIGRDAYARTSAGGSERPFKASDSAQPEHDQLFEERAAKTTADAKARAEAEAKAKYKPETPTSNTPKGFDADGNYAIDAHGFVTSDKDSPIKFATQKQAGLWAVNVGNKKSSGQTFEVANHPSGEGFTVWEQTRKAPAAKAPPAPEGQSLVPVAEKGAAPQSNLQGDRAAKSSRTEDATSSAQTGRPATGPAASGVASSPPLETPAPREKARSAPEKSNVDRTFEDRLTDKEDAEDRDLLRQVNEYHDEERGKRSEKTVLQTHAELSRIRLEQSNRRELLEDPKKRRAWAKDRGISEKEARELLQQNYDNNYARLSDLEREVKSPYFLKMEAEAKARAAKLKSRPVNENENPTSEAGAPSHVHEGKQPAHDEGQPAERPNAQAQNDEGSRGPRAEHPEQGRETGAPGRQSQASKEAGQQDRGERGSGAGRPTEPANRSEDGQGEGVKPQSPEERAAENEAWNDKNFEAVKAEEPGLTREAYEKRRAAGKAFAKGFAGGKTETPEETNKKVGDFGTTLYSNPFADPKTWRIMADMFTGPGKWAAHEADRFVGAIKNDIDRFKAALKNTTSLVSWDRVKAIGNMLKVISFGSKEGQLWSLYKRTNLDGIKELHSWIHSDPAGGRAVQGTVAENIQRDSSEWSNELRDILGDLTKGRRPSEATEVLTQLGKQIRAGTARSSSAMGKAAAGIKTLLDKIHDRATTAGMKLGKVESNYLPRVLDTTKVLDNRAKFLAAATRAFKADHPDMVDGEAEASAESYLAHIEQQENGIRPGSTDFVRPGAATGGGNSTKGRTFSGKAERIFSDAGFYHENPADALSVYVRRMARDAALTEKLGPDLENWRRIKDSIIKDPQGLELFAHVHDLMSKMLGFQPPISRVASGISNALRTIGSLTYLSGAAVLHTVQPALAAVRTGRPSDLIRTYGNTLKVLAGAAKDDVKLAERLGLVERDMHDVLNETLAVQDASATSTKFFKVIGLEPLLKAVSVASMKTGMHFIGHLSDEFAAGSSTLATTRKYLNSFGIAEGDHAGFTKWVRGLDGTPGFDDMQTKYGKMLGLALQRMVNQTIMRPNAAYRPLWAEHPFGKFAYSITSYMQSFSTLANERAWMMAKAAASERGLTPQDRIAHLMPAVMLATVVAPLTYMMYEARNALLNKNPDRKDPAPSEGPIDDAWDIADVFSKSSLMGRWDSAFNLVRGMKYDRSAASAVTGPEISGLAQTAVQAIKTLATDKDSSTYAKRELADNVYRNFVFPSIMAAVVQSEAAVAGPIASLGTIGTIFTLRNPTVRHMLFTDPVTGSTSEDVRGASGVRKNRPDRAERKERRSR